MTKLPLTPEQAGAVEHSVDLVMRRGYGNHKIEALAGTGKTTTLNAVGQSMPNKKGLYLAFNKSIADDAARKFPKNVACKTAHALAFRDVGSKYKDRLNQRLTAYAIARELGVGHWGTFQNTTLCMLAQQTVARFCQGDAEEIGPWQTPRDAIKSFDGKPGVDVESLKEHVVKIAQQLWKRMEDPGATLPVTHDFYLKKWALSQPRVFCDFIMLDEAQDANPLLLKILRSLNKPVIFVGDQYQQIYSWRGAVNAMQKMESSTVSHLTQSFRFGAAIAEQANEILHSLGAGVRISGNPKVRSSVKGVTNPHAVLCRTNSGAIGHLIDALKRGQKPMLQGGTKDIAALIRGIEDLRSGMTPTHPELILFSDYDQLVLYAESEMGQDLQSVLNLLDSHDAKELLEVFDSVALNNEASCDVVISTAHKSKGREWKTVLLADDFRGPDDKGYHSEEGNLAYVAVTRAIETLDLTTCDVVRQMRDERLGKVEEMLTERRRGGEHSFDV